MGEDENTQQDFEGLTQEIANVILAWSNLEMALVMLLESIISRSASIDRINLSSAIFYAPEGLAARIAIVDNAFCAWARNAPDKDSVLALWSGTMKRINRNKQTRNLAAHGQVVQLHSGRHRGHQLMQPVFHPRFQQSMQKPDPKGCSANDLKNTARAIADIERTVATFSLLVQCHSANDTQTYAQNIRVLQEAAKSRMRSAHQAPQNPEDS